MKNQATGSGASPPATATSLRTRAMSIALRNRPLQGLVRMATRSRLRVVGFHGVPNQEHFEMLVAWIVSRYTPVNEQTVAAAIAGDTALPPYAVWFTFDDGLISTFEAGETLARFGVQATLFVNPAMIEEPQLHWFTILDYALAKNLIDSSESERFSRSRLKSIDDAVRRQEIDKLKQRIEQSYIHTPTTLSGSLDDIKHWLQLGHHIGNHTWDHPCLGTCTKSAQEDQVRKAHDWLERHGVPVRFLAFPNGDWAPVAASVAESLGYVGSLLFDHKLASSTFPNPHQISRIRIDADAPLHRVSSLVSGLHTVVYSLLRPLRPGYHSPKL